MRETEENSDWYTPRRVWGTGSKGKLLYAHGPPPPPQSPRSSLPPVVFYWPLQHLQLFFVSFHILVIIVTTRGTFWITCTGLWKTCASSPSAKVCKAYRYEMHNTSEKEYSIHRDEVFYGSLWTHLVSRKYSALS
jgi:hypothetical protein